MGCWCEWQVFFFNDTATTEIYTLSLHDALPISGSRPRPWTSTPPSRLPASSRSWWRSSAVSTGSSSTPASARRSEEHTSELQSRQYLVCRLLLEKKKKWHKSSSTHWRDTGSSRR